MIRHIYDLPYVQEDADFVEDEDSFEDEDPAEDVGLAFCMNVFKVADKYDVVSLRQRVALDFHALLEDSWDTKEFVECVHKLCGPDAIRLVDSSLQIAIAVFFTNDISNLIHHDSLVEMFKEDKSFIGQFLTGLVESASKDASQQSIRPRRYARLG
jgi:hypothetical protein